MLHAILTTLALTSLTVVMHAMGTAIAIGWFMSRADSFAGRPLAMLMTRAIVLVSALLLLSVGEALVWALALLAAGVLPDLETAIYFSFTSYTTVGYGDVVLPPGIRLLGPIEGAVGLLMFGWSTGVLVAAVGRIAAAIGLHRS